MTLEDLKEHILTCELIEDKETRTKRIEELFKKLKDDKYELTIMGWEELFKKHPDILSPSYPVVKDPVPGERYYEVWCNDRIPLTCLSK